MRNKIINEGLLGSRIGLRDLDPAVDLTGGHTIGIERRSALVEVRRTKGIAFVPGDVDGLHRQACRAANLVHPRNRLTSNVEAQISHAYAVAQASLRVADFTGKRPASEQASDRDIFGQVLDGEMPGKWLHGCRTSRLNAARD